MNSLEEGHEPTAGLNALNWPPLVEQPRGEGIKQPSEELRPCARSQSRLRLVRTAAPIVVALVALAALLVGCLRSCGGERAARRTTSTTVRSPAASANGVLRFGAGREEVTSVATGLRADAAKPSRTSDRGRRRLHLFVPAAATEHDSLGASAASHAGPAPARMLAAGIARANVRAQLEFGFER